MPLRPSDVRDASFRVVYRGYSVREVDGFLDQVERELRRLLDGEEQSPPDGARGVPVQDDEPRVEAGSGEVLASRADTSRDEAGAAAADGTPGDPSLGALRLLRCAEETADRTTEEARAEAARLREEAEAAAVETLEEARAQARQLLADAQAEADQRKADAALAEAEARVRLEDQLASLERHADHLQDRVATLQRLEHSHRERTVAALTRQLELVQEPWSLPAQDVPARQ